MYQKGRGRHGAVGIDGSPELLAMEEASCAVLSAYVMVRVAIIIARLLVPRKALKINLMRFRELVPAQKRSWGVQIGTLGEYLRGKKILYRREFVLLGIVILLFTNIAP